MSRLESILRTAAAPNWMLKAGAAILLGLTSCYSTAENISIGMPLNKVKQIVAKEGILAVKYKLMLDEATARIEKDNDDYDAYFWKDLAEKRLGFRKSDVGFDAVFLTYLKNNGEIQETITGLENSFKESEFIHRIAACSIVRSWKSDSQSAAVKYAHELLKDTIFQLDERIRSGSYQSPRDASSDYYLRGTAKRLLKSFEEAIADFESAMKLRPDDDCLELKGDIEECKKEIE